MNSTRTTSGRHSFVDIVRTAVAAAAFVATPIIVVLMSPMWRSGDMTVGTMRLSAGFALVLPALLTLAISLTSIGDLKLRLASAVTLPITIGFIVAQMSENSHSALYQDSSLTITFMVFAAGGALLGALVGEALPRRFAQSAKNAIC